MKFLARAILIFLLSALMGARCFAQQTSQQPAASDQPQTQTGSEQGTTPAPPAHPTTLAQTREMFALMHFRATMQSMLHTNLEEQRKRAPFIPEDVWQDFEDSYAKVDFAEVFLPIYQKYLSQEDAAKALQFYRTPAGQHTLSVMPTLMQEIARASQNKGEEIAEQVFERHHQEIEDAAKKFGQPAAPPANPSAGQDQPK